MQQIRAVIVDDEPAGRDAVRTMLRERPQVRVVAEARNGREAEEIIRRERPDLLFLDVQMPDRDGFAVLEALGPEVPRGVVFVTAHDEHAVRAFEVQAMDYLLKPFGRQRFNAVVSRAIDRLATGGAPPRRLAVRTGTRLTLVDIDAIDWMEAVGDYVRIHTGKQAHIIAQRLYALERLLGSSGFIRVHRSFIVNGSRVHELQREADGSGTLVLRDGVRLRVARDRWDALCRALRLE